MYCCREQDEMSLATAMSLSTIHPTSHEKENQSKPQDLAGGGTKVAEHLQNDNVQVPIAQLQPPPGLKLSHHEPAFKESCAWPDLTPHLEKPCVGISTSSFAPPPPGFIVPKPPPGYASANYKKSNPSTKMREDINIIEQARTVLDNDQKFLEFRHLSGSYAKGTKLYIMVEL